MPATASGGRPALIEVALGRGFSPRDSPICSRPRFPFGMPADGPWIPVLVMAAVLTVPLFAVAVPASIRTAAARHDDTALP